MKKIYLAGPISGLTFEGAQDWRTYFMNTIDQQIACFSPLRGKDYLKMRGPLEGSYDEFPLSTDRGITTRDRADCMGADLVVFNMLGATRVSMGTMVEFGWADAARVPSVLIMEKEGNIHDYPMVREIAGFRVDNLEDAIAISEIVLLHKANPKRKALVDNTGGEVLVTTKLINRRSSTGDRRDHNRFYNTRGCWDRHQADYTTLGRAAKTGDRRKSNV
jgi:nucleoside 2-deoxyribosyltransferase